MSPHVQYVRKMPRTREVEFLLSTHGPCIPKHESVCVNTVPKPCHIPFSPLISIQSRRRPPFQSDLGWKGPGWRSGRRKPGRAPLLFSVSFWDRGDVFSENGKKYTSAKKEPEGIGGGGGGGGRVALSSDLMHKPCINAGGGGDSVCIAGGDL